MGIVASIVSAVLKSVAGNKFGSGLVKDLIGISIDGISEKGINEITDFVNEGRTKISNILSKENIKSMDIPEESIDYVVEEIKDLVSRIDITDEVFRQCEYNSINLSFFLWDKYRKDKGGYVECENSIKCCLFKIAQVLIELLRESEDFEKAFLIQISNSVDDANVGLQNIHDYMKENFGKLDENSQIVLNILLSILKQMQKMNMQNNRKNSKDDKKEKFKNNKKEDYIKNWKSRLFLHIDNEERPITLAEAFIMPDYEMYKNIKRIGFSDDDTFDQIIEKFIRYDKTSTMLIEGVPGIGKSTMTSWIANRYIDDDNLIILRFRDWESEELEKGLLKAICNTLGCKKSNLECKIVVLDGFDEIKVLDVRERVLDEFFYAIKDFENFKCMITSRLHYINANAFQNVFKVKEFDIFRIETFCKVISGNELENKDKIESNLEVLGIPVILYMAIMSGVDISENPTKPELYNRVFAKEGGIFDKFSREVGGYDKGTQILRERGNTEKYLGFLRKIAFKMFEKNNLSLNRKECMIPNLVFQGKNVSILEFPIKHLFDNTEYNIEFVHKSIYEYFMAKYIYVSISEVMHISKEKSAKVLGKLLVRNNLYDEILEFLKYDVKNNMGDQYNLIEEVFNLMMKRGMTYYAHTIYKSVLHSEMTIFQNMMKIVGLWENASIKHDNMIRHYISLCKRI